MRILIKVTPAILEESKMCNPNTGDVTENCAISLAVREIFPESMVGYMNCPDYGIYQLDVRIKLPPEAGKFIKQFDQYNSPEQRVLMSPISFEIDVPDSYIESIGIDEVKEILSKSATLELVTPI